MRVHRLPGDSVLLGNSFSAVAHGKVVVDVPETVDLNGVFCLELAEKRICARQKEAVGNG